MSRLPSSVILGIDQTELSAKLSRFMVGPGSDFPENHALLMVDECGHTQGSLTREELAFLVLRGAHALMTDGLAQEAGVRG